MAGVYVHIPFCKQACIYCDFHFSTLQGDRALMSKAIVREAEMRKDYLDDTPLRSLYFGGGTPSVLPLGDIVSIIEAIDRIFGLKEDAEICLEANPDDLNEEYLKGLAESRVNRLSIGIQSFKEKDLKFMNRAHSADEAKKCLALLDKYGFTNYTIDLIYGLPNQSNEEWLWQLNKLKEYQVPHFSAYALTVEEKTKLAHLERKGLIKVEEGKAAQHFKMLQEFARAEAYEHYELSNFAKPGYRAVHNGSYWEGKAYLGLGPAAHSFNGKERSWNISNNSLYLKAISKGELPSEQEELSEIDRFNEFVMTKLRLVEGIHKDELLGFSEAFINHWELETAPLLKLGKLKLEEEVYSIPSEWRFFSDGIASEIFRLKDEY